MPEAVSRLREGSVTVAGQMIRSIRPSQNSTQQGGIIVRRRMEALRDRGRAQRTSARNPVLPRRVRIRPVWRSPLNSSPGLSVMIGRCHWTTPNGHKITLFLEEAEGCRIASSRSTSGAASSSRRIPAYRAQQPYPGDRRPGRRPTAVSRFDLRVGRRSCSIWPTRFSASSLQDLRGRNVALQWLFWQMGGLRADGRAESPFQPVRAGENSLRHRTPRQGNRAPLRRR